jgi:hypothetical protein
VNDDYSGTTEKHCQHKIGWNLEERFENVADGMSDSIWTPNQPGKQFSQIAATLDTVGRSEETPSQ